MPKTSYHNIVISVEVTDGELGPIALRYIAQQAMDKQAGYMFPLMNVMGVEVVPMPEPELDGEW